MTDITVEFAQPAPPIEVEFTDAVPELTVEFTEAVVLLPTGGGFEHVQSVPLATWVIAHSFGRRPNVAIYASGEQVEADVTATSTQATITFPGPVAGTAVLT